MPEGVLHPAAWTGKLQTETLPRGVLNWQLL